MASTTEPMTLEHAMEMMRRPVATATKIDGIIHVTIWARGTAGLGSGIPLGYNDAVALRDKLSELLG